MLQLMSEDPHYISQLRAGENQAFQRLISEHQLRLYRVILAFVRSPETAEDLCQEVFVEVVESIHQFKAQAQLSTWLHRIAVHKSLDYLRATRRQKRFAHLVSLFGIHNELIVDPADPVHPGILLEDQERSRLLFAAIDLLPEQQRIAYTLCRVEEMSVKEAAELMKTSPKAVESLLSRARNSLQKRLEQYYQQHMQ